MNGMGELSMNVPTLRSGFFFFCAAGFCGDAPDGAGLVVEVVVVGVFLLIA
jgi:hypothetical protein